MTAYPFAFAIAAIAVLSLALRWPKLGSRTLRRAEAGLYLFAQRRRLAVFSIASLTIACNAAIALATRIPQPWIVDEFSYLLAADTFASGRLSNPTHPMWIHFESPQIIQKPSYVSKYPPAQGLMLAAGQIVSGQPIVGVWLSAGLACGAICWMLQGWFRSGVALIGALLAVYRIGVTTYWSQSYWGGMMAVLGGALVFGALRRVLSRPRVGTSILLGVGLAILANSRPYEGLLASLPVFVALGYRCLRGPTVERMLIVRRVVIPLCALGIMTLLWMGYYNLRQTGNTFVSAYQVYTATYQIEPVFKWETFRGQPLSQHLILQQNNAGKAIDIAQYERSWRAAAPKLHEHLFNFWSFYCHVAFTLPFLIGLAAMRSFFWCALASVIAVMSGLLIGSMWIFPHYSAPMAGPFFVVITYGWSRLRAYRIGQHRTGLFVARTIVISCTALLAVRTAAACAGIKQETRQGSLVGLLTYALSAQPPVADWPYQRAAIQRQLERSGVASLVLVRYTHNDRTDREWVYNKANIDRAPVVWAHEIDAEYDRKLVEYFHDRQVWMLDANQLAPKLVPYAPTASATATGAYKSEGKPQ